MALCPNCATAISVSAEVCPKCSASFEGSQAWKPAPQSDEERTVLAAMLDDFKSQAAILEPPPETPESNESPHPASVRRHELQVESNMVSQPPVQVEQPKMPILERTVRIVFATPLALAGAFAFFASLMLAQHGVGEIAPFVGIPAVALLFSAYGIATARSGGWLALSFIVGFLLLLVAVGATYILGAL